MNYGKFNGEQDDFHTPKPRAAAGKTVVDAVLDGVLAAGNTLVSLAAGLLAGALILYSGYSIFDAFNIQMKAASSNWDLLQYKPAGIEDADSPLTAGDLAGLVPDYRAWLTVYDTGIDYPVLQGRDDLYYASHDIYGKSSLTGAIYLAAANSGDFSDDYHLIYGHHMESGAMFGDLDRFTEQAYFERHREGIVVAPSAVYDVTFFAVVRTDAYESTFYSVQPAEGNPSKAKEVMDFLRANGAGGVGLGTEVLVFDGQAAQHADRILALSTCAAASTSGRLIVLGKMAQRDLLMVTANGYDGIFDGQAHGPGTVHVTFPEGTRIAYSVDGGGTWSSQMPALRDVGTMEVLVRATSATHGSDTTQVTLRVRPRPVTVQADAASKYVGQPDPTFTARVTGLLAGETITYALERINSRIENEAGFYPGRIVASGAAYQGNYVVSFEPGDFTILSAEPTASPQPITTDTPRPTRRVTPVPTAVFTRRPLASSSPLWVSLLWLQDTPADRPEAVHLVLQADGAARIVTLTAKNGWAAEVPDLPADTPFTWTAPAVNGYGQAAIKTEGRNAVITYVRRTEPTPDPQPCTLRVHYQDALTGQPVAADEVRTLYAGQAYDVVSPLIPGMDTNSLRVSGVMDAGDREITVLYLRGDADDLMLLTENTAPPALHGVRLNTGDCYE